MPFPIARYFQVDGCTVCATACTDSAVNITLFSLELGIGGRKPQARNTISAVLSERARPFRCRACENEPVDENDPWNTLTPLAPDKKAASSALDVRALCVVYESEASTVVELKQDQEVILGRDPSLEVPLSDLEVSRHHLSLEWSGARLMARDLSSRNGTQLNGSRIEGATEVFSGDELTLGSVRVVVTITSQVLAGARRLLPHGSFMERLADEAARSRRFSRPIALAMVRFEGNELTVERGLETLSSRLRDIDVLATYGPREFQVLLAEEGAATARQLVQRIVEAIRCDKSCRAWAGLAVSPRGEASADSLIERARRALRRAITADSMVEDLETEPSSDRTVPVAQDPATMKVLSLVERVAPLETTVLVLGETGTGKEVIASEIHRRSSRADAPLLALNIAALAPTLIESELFGHEQGAFTGAVTSKVGYFEAASGGTLLLDEIGELPLPLQVRLLRVLETMTVTRVGGTSQISIDVRIIAATNRDLGGLVEEGTFRQDLFFRLNTFTILLPPLRDRPLDIVPLAQRFVDDLSRAHRYASPRFTSDALDILKSYRWPGNIRELRNVVERAVILAEDEEIDPDCLPQTVTSAAAASGSASFLKKQLDAFERTRILEVLESCGWNKTLAARELGISRRTMFYKLSRMGLAPPRKP